MHQQGKLILFHGTIYEFSEIDTTFGKPYKDFGKGFYTSVNKKHSENLAKRNREIALMRNPKAKINPWLYVYELNMELLKKLNVKEFPKADREWMRFVVQNRSNKKQKHKYDIVIGPTANDDTRTSIQAFFAGAYGDVKSDRAIDMLIIQIEPEKLPSQFYFANNKATRLLTFKKRVQIK
ncbi:MAG: DUF3990 domain-containing protein [Fibromonadaceae bacterium]|jgi:hypothetical protein|nr:DUF3990 domain-containing protein [Fibromonadaceae bacterium]